MEEQEIDEELKAFLTKEGYYELRVIPGRGICGLMGFMYTIGLVEGLEKTGYKGRWCYPREKAVHALLALKAWDGIGDPLFDWIKYKGYTEYSNPKLQQHEL